MNVSQQELCQEFAGAVFDRSFEPFVHHFKPEDTCQNGRITNSDCMERGLGLDDRGYDCSGLVVASLCETLDIAITDYNPELRHVRQMAALIKPSSQSTEIGDIAFKLTEDGTHAFVVVHVDPVSGGATAIHASIDTGDVTTDIVPVSKLNGMQRIQVTDLVQKAV